MPFEESFPLRLSCRSHRCDAQARCQAHCIDLRFSANRVTSVMFLLEPLI